MEARRTTKMGWEKIGGRRLWNGSYEHREKARKFGNSCPWLISKVRRSEVFTSRTMGDAAFEDYFGNMALPLGKTTRSPHGEENHGRVLKTVIEMSGRMEASDDGKFSLLGFGVDSAMENGGLAVRYVPLFLASAAVIWSLGAGDACIHHAVVLLLQWKDTG